MTSERLLLIDADLPKRLAPELTARGRVSHSLQKLGLKDLKDPKLIPRLWHDFGDDRWVLVTGDDQMPFDHAAVIEEYGATLAIIDPKRPHGSHQDAWRREITHRWAHKMASQPGGTILRYNETAGRPWKRRIRPVANPRLFK